MPHPKTIAIVIPCFNEEAVLGTTITTLLSILDRMVELDMATKDSFLLCVDDGSTDTTWQLINDRHYSDIRVKGISLAHNRGHQYALLAGLMTAKGHCEAAISIDADLQDNRSNN